MSIHSLTNIERKLKMNASVTPSEMLLVVRNIITRIESLEERLNGLETTRTSGKRASRVSKD